jgi:hypothetical protein
MHSGFSRSTSPPDGDHEIGARPRRLNYDVPRAAAVQVATWALGVATDATTEPEDLERIDRVADFVRAIALRRDVPPPSEEDLLSVLGILITALEVDCEAPGLGRSVGAMIEELDPLLDAVCARALAPRRVVPSARCRAPAIVRHRFLIP